MKVTKKQLKQIIREEIQQEGFLDSIERFIKGTSKEYDAFIKKYEAARAKRKTMNLMQAAEDGNKQPFFDYIEMMTKLGEENLRFDPKDIGKDQKNIQKRIAKFRTVVAFVDGETEHYTEGIVKGIIINERRGIDGFGYDSIFMPDSIGLTYAQMNTVQKNSMSHRFKALKKMKTFLVPYLKKKEGL